MNSQDKVQLMARCLEMAIQMISAGKSTRQAVELAEIYYKACFNVPDKFDRS